MVKGTGDMIVSVMRKQRMSVVEGGQSYAV